MTELKHGRNLRPAFAKFGLYGFMAYSGLDTFVLRGKCALDVPPQAQATTRC